MRSITIIFILLPFCLHCQVKDDFSDGNFTSDPAWTGDTASFRVNSSKELQLNSSGADTSCLFTRLDPTEETEWSFLVRMSFNTSQNNYSRVYLCSASAEISGDMDAIYLQLGGAGDSVFLLRQDGTAPIPLFTYPVIRTNKPVNTLRIKVCLDTDGNWTMMADSTGGIRFTTYGSFTYKCKLPLNWMGVYCRYTSSNSSKFIFDDFYAGEILRDTIPPSVLCAGFSDSLTIRIKCSEFIDSTRLSVKSNFALKNNPEMLAKAYISEQDPDIIYIRINEKANALFCDTLFIRKISDNSANLMADSGVFICYYVPGPCLAGDLLINEVLFDPDEQGARFIEFFNNSEKVLDLGTVIAGTAGGTDSVYRYYPISGQGRMLYPGGYYVITADSSRLCSRYYIPCPENIAGPEHFPSMNSDSGRICLLNCADSAGIDRMFYSKSMHLKFLSNTEGVSLERLDPGVPSGRRSNWQSASATSGFASPGYENSHYAVSPGKGPGIGLSGLSFSPDNDGVDDLLIICLHDVEAGTIVSVRIYDPKGNLVKSIADPSAASENATFIWDGTSDDSRVVDMGYYIVYSESISISGKHNHDKKAVAVVKKLR